MKIMLKSLIILFIVFLFSFNMVHAGLNKWEYYSKRDKFDNSVSKGVLVRNNNNDNLGLILSKKSCMLVLSSHRNHNFLFANQFLMKIDDNEIHDMMIYEKSVKQITIYIGESGVKDIINQLKKGNKLWIRVKTKSSRYDYKFSLNNSKNAINKLQDEY